MMPELKKFYLGVKALIKNDKKEIFLLLKNPRATGKLNIRLNQEYWDLPGGRLYWGDTVLQTLERELAEEVGLITFTNDGLFYATISNLDNNAGKNGLILFVYNIVTTDTFNPKLNSENIKYGWFSNVKAAELLSLNYPTDFIDRIINHDPIEQAIPDFTP